jgi:hypothetical protein
MALELEFPDGCAEILAMLALVCVESHAFMDGLIAAQAHDVKRSLEANNISALRKKLAVDLSSTVPPRLSPKGV